MLFALLDREVLMIRLTGQSVMHIYDRPLRGCSKKLSVGIHYRNDEQQNNILILLKHPNFFGAGLIWIGLNKILLNELITTTKRIQAADSGNSALPR